MPNHLFPPSIETISGQKVKRSKGQKVKRYWILLKTKAKNWPFALKMLTLLAQVGTTNAAGVVLVPSSREKHPSRYASTIEPAAAGCVETRERSSRLKPGSQRLPLKPETRGRSPRLKLGRAATIFSRS